VLGLAGLAGTAALATAGSIVWFLRRPSPIPVGTTHSTYRDHNDIVYGIDWSRDGKYIASWGHDHTMQVWDATTFVPIRTDAMAMVVAWSPNWQLIASGPLYALQVWERSTGRILLEHTLPWEGTDSPSPEPVKRFVQWSSDGKYLANSIGYDSTQVWSMSTDKILFSKPLSAIAWSPDGKRLFGMP
jgi:WD40 repeat protein